MIGQDGAKLLLQRVLEASNRSAATEQAVAELALVMNRRFDAIEQVAREQARAEQWQTADEIAAWLGVSTECVRDHADEWGVARVGDGPKARLRFQRSRVEAALAGESPAKHRPTPRRNHQRRPQTTASGAPLLPVGPKGAS